MLPLITDFPDKLSPEIRILLKQPTVYTTACWPMCVVILVMIVILLTFDYRCVLSGIERALESSEWMTFVTDTGKPRVFYTDAICLLNNLDAL